MIEFIKKFLEKSSNDPYPIVEGKYADSYTDLKTIELIRTGYKERWMPKPTPYTHPALFDPFEPPIGWRYDPFYEEWIKTL